MVVIVVVVVVVHQVIDSVGDTRSTAQVSHVSAIRVAKLHAL